MTWGEFLDTEWYQEGIVIERPVDPITLDPWRTSGRWEGRIFLISRELIEKVAQTERIIFCYGDSDRVRHIREEIFTGGLREPLELVVDLNGRVVLRDGHHRLLATDGLEHFQKLPVIITHSDRIRVDGAVAIHAGILHVLLSSSVPA